MSCGCEDSDYTIDNMYFEKTTSSMPTVCEDCETVIAKGDPVVLYHGSIGECECDEEGEDYENGECTCGCVEPWGMVACPTCHRMRQDLQNMGYCILYPGLQRLLEDMEDDDLSGVRDRLAFKDTRAMFAKRTMNKVHPRCLLTYHRSSYDPWNIHNYKCKLSWIFNRQKEAAAKATASATSVWQRRTCQEMTI